MTSLAKQETLITALDGVLRADWGRDPAQWISANNRLFDAVCGIAGYGATAALADDQAVIETASVMAADFLCKGNV